MSVSHVDSSLSDHCNADCTAHHGNSLILERVACLHSFAVSLPHVVCHSVRALHAVFGHARQKTVCHSVAAIECQCVTCCVWSCRAEDRLSQRNCNLVDNSVVMSLINQSMNRSVRASEALLFIV